MQSAKIAATQTNPNEESEIKFPYNISFIDCDPSDAVRFQIEQQLAKLGRLSDRISDCKVTVRIPHKHSFHINVALDLPGKRIAVSRDPKDKGGNGGDIQAAVHSAFQKLERQTEDYIRERKGL